MEQIHWSKLNTKTTPRKKFQAKEIFYQNIFKDMIVNVYSFSLISFIQTFQWIIREFNATKAGFLRLNILVKMDIGIPLSFFLNIFPI